MDQIISADKKPRFTFFHWFVLFILIFAGLRYLLPTENVAPEEPQKVVAFTPLHQSFLLDSTVTLTFENRTENRYTFGLDCPGEPFDVSRFVDGNWLPLTAESEDCKQGEEILALKPGEKYVVDYAAWNDALFDKAGKYRVQASFTLPGDPPNVIPLEAEFEVHERSWFGMLWEEALFIPIFNLLIFITSVLPGHNLGWAIILLTLIIRLILLVPNQHALRSQRAMQELQPKIEEIKRKYASDQQKVAQETFALWKQYKVNPMGSCLPLLIQLPIIIGLFYAVSAANDGFSSSEIHLLYGSLSQFDTSLISTSFFGLAMGATGVWWLAVMIGVVQFLQMRMMMVRIKRKKGEAAPDDPAMAMNQTMQYVMPLMIAFMTYTFPAGVGIYWGTSTLFGLGQQWFVNREKIVK